MASRGKTGKTTSTKLDNKLLDQLEARVRELEGAGVHEMQLDDLEFTIVSDEVVPSGGDTTKKSDLRVHSSGNFRYWRETNDLRGAKKYSNWSVNVAIKDTTGKAIVCEWIRITRCSHRINQSGVVVEKPAISFTTPRTSGWPDISWRLEFRARNAKWSVETTLVG